jgi:phage/plasmid-like protein (TIGR03299 family)
MSTDTLVAASRRKLPWGASIVKSAAGDPYTSTAVKAVAGRTATAALVKAGLDWTVELSDVVAPPLPNEDGVTPECPVPGKRWARRTDTGHVLGILGPNTHVLQNRDVAEFADTLVETEASSLVGMGHTKADEDDQFGTKVYSVVRLDDPILPNGMPEEATEVFLLMSNAFDSSQSFQVSILPLRMVCANGMRVALKDHTMTWRIRHTATMKDRLEEARDTIQRAAGWAVDFQEELERLLDINVEERTDKVLDLILPKVPAKKNDEGSVTNGAAITRRDKQRDSFMDVWAETTTLSDGVRFTAYGAFNAFTEWDQWSGDTEGLELARAIQQPSDSKTSRVYSDLLTL